MSALAPAKVTSTSIAAATSRLAADGRRDHIRALTGLRFFPALWVVLHHFSFFVPYPAPVKVVAGNGQSGVTIFFVLSGFVLTYNYIDGFGRGTVRYGDFLRARFARIGPMYLLTLAVATPIALALIGASDVRHPASVIGLSWLANLLLLHAYVPARIFHEWNVPSWSLSAEVTFYLVLPLFIRHVIARSKTMMSLIVLAAGLFMVEVLLFSSVSLVLSRAYDEQKFGFLMLYLLRFNPVIRIWEFLLGCTIAAMFVRAERLAKSGLLWQIVKGTAFRNCVLLSAVAAAALMLKLAGLAFGHSYVTRELTTSVLIVPVAVLLIITLAAGPSLLTAVLEHPLLVLLGEASYSLYIIHEIPGRVLEQRAAEGSVTGVGESLIIIAALVLLSVVLYLFVETPARRALRPRPRRAAIPADAASR